jgi:hypothetical protein
MNAPFLGGPGSVAPYFIPESSRDAGCIQYFRQLSTRWPLVFPFPVMQGPPLPLLKDLKYNQRGLQDLRRHLGVLPQGMYNAHRPSFDAADIAWIATALGLASSTDSISPNHFPPELNTLREGMPRGNSGATIRALMRSRLQKLVFDLVGVIFLSVYLVVHLIF